MPNFVTPEQADGTLRVAPEKARALLRYEPPDHDFVGMGHCKDCLLRCLAAIPSKQSTGAGGSVKIRKHLPACEFKAAPLGTCGCMETLLDQAEAHVAELEGGMMRLGSVEAFTATSRPDPETVARIDFARTFVNHRTDASWR